ncbi:MAG: radical SAM protein [Magnetococcus sp. YQC-3]
MAAPLMHPDSPPPPPSMAELQEYLRRRVSPGESYLDLLRFPRYLEIETVNHCNARCPMCTIDAWERKAGVMKDVVFEKIASELVEAARTERIIRVSLFRDGEPLLDKKLAQRVHRLKSGGIPHVSTTTNASLLNEKRARDLLEAGLDSLFVSMDSLHKEVYESIRVKLVFEEVRDNILRFIDLRDRLRPETKISIRMTRQEANQAEWPAFQDFWRSRLQATDRVYYHDIHNWGGQADKVPLIAESHPSYMPCVSLWSLCIIFANGDLPMCSVDYNGRFKNGNVLQNSIRELWHSAQMERWRAWHLANQQGQQTGLCQTCNAWEMPSDYAITPV